MKRRIFWFSAALTVGFLIAVLAVVVPAQAGYPAQEADPNEHNPPPGQEIFGVIDSFPEGLLGSWTVDGIVYTATTGTHFSMYGGPFYTGACVQVRYDPQDFTAYAIKMVGADHCSQEAKMYFIGLIEQVPEAYSETLRHTPGVSGTWMISGTEFVSTLDTRLSTRNGPLEVGACAGVEYRVVEGVNVADAIRSEKLYRCFKPDSYNQAYGYVITFPEDLYGAWVISNTADMSLTFMTTQSTRISTRHYPLEAGACVKVKYFSDQGVNYASSVKTTSARHCEGYMNEFQPLSKIYTLVESMPPTGTITGTWVLAGVNFTATQETRIEAEEGPLAVGTCAEAKYDPTNGAMLIHKLESEEEQDCQARDGSPRSRLYGVIEAAPTSGYTGTWQVSGVSFSVTPSTTLESRHGEFIIGAYVKVYFTYDASTGERVAQLVKTHVAPGYGRIRFRGRFGGWGSGFSGDQIYLDGNPYQADAAIDAPASLAIGDMVWINAYQDPDGMFVTQVVLDSPVFLPVVQGR